MDNSFLPEDLQDHIRDVTSRVSLKWAAMQARDTDTHLDHVVAESLVVESAAEEVVHDLLHQALDGLSRAAADNNGKGSVIMEVDWPNALVAKIQEMDADPGPANDTGDGGHAD